MTQPLVRPLTTDNRMLRATGGMDIRVPLSSGIGAAYETPTIGELAVGTGQAASAGVVTALDDIERRQEEERAWRFEMAQLSTSLETAMDDDRETIIAQIETLETERKAKADSATKEAIAAGKLQTPEALNTQYKDIGVTFDRATSPEEARLIADGRKAQIIRDALIEKTPSGFVSGAAMFGAGLVAMATDPLEVATMFIPIVGAAGKAAAVARFGRVGGRVAVGALEGGVGNALTEPVYYGLSRAQQLDYTMSDALMNVGLGFVLGGGIGGVAGAFARAEPAPRVEMQPPRLEVEALDADFNREIAGTALRQFITGQAVNISKFLDGTDLRSSTTISRVNGIEFQATPSVSREIAAEIKPSYLVPFRDEGPMTFDTIQKADAFAAKVGGEPLLRGNSYVVRVKTEGDLVRTPYGKAVTFDKLITAEKFLANVTTLPETAKIIPVMQGGRRVYAISRDMTGKDIIGITALPDSVDIPDGINTREVAVLPDAQARIQNAVRGTLARRGYASALAEHAKIEPLADEKAARAFDAPIKSSFMEDDIADMEMMARQLEGRMTPEMLSDMEAFEMADKAARSYAEVAEAAAICMART